MIGSISPAVAEVDDIMEEFLESAAENMDTSSLARLPDTSMSDESMYQPHHQSGEEVSDEGEESDDDEDQDMGDDDRYNSAGEEVRT